MKCYNRLKAQTTNVKQHLIIDSKEIKLENVPNKSKPLLKKLFFQCWNGKNFIV